MDSAIILTYTRTYLHVPDYWFGLINALFFSGTIIAGLWINHKDRFFTNKLSNNYLRSFAFSIY